MPNPILAALDQARRELIDLTRRNRLLNAPLEGKRPWCMAVSGQSPDDLLDKLYRQENFRGYAFKARSEEASDQKLPAVLSSENPSFTPEPGSTRRPRLQTRIPPDKLHKRLAK